MTPADRRVIAACAAFVVLLLLVLWAVGHDLSEPALPNGG